MVAWNSRTNEAGVLRRAQKYAGSYLRTLDQYSAPLMRMNLQPFIGKSAFVLIDIDDFFDEFLPRLLIPAQFVDSLDQFVAEFYWLGHT